MAQYTDFQLDALRELGNIGSGTAGTALSNMLGRSVDLSVPVARLLTVAEAVEAAGAPDLEVTGVVVSMLGDLEGVVLIVYPPADAARLCTMLGVEPDSEIAVSAIAESANILGTAYLNALAEMTGLRLEPTPPQSVTDMLAAIVASVLAASSGLGEIAFMLDSELKVEGDNCHLSFLLLPTPEGVDELLRRLGVGG